ncbi:MAG: hypothetical protein ACXVCY_08185 [Pseudobdellovibrionaceae bacterium]
MRILISVLGVMIMGPVLAFQGGVSGGGGNLISPKAPSSLVSPDTVEQMIHHSRWTLFNYISLKRTAFKNNQLPEQQVRIFAPIFQSNINIEEIMNNVQVHVEERKSCHDYAHRSVDGSTLSEHPNSICISAYNIAAKADSSDIPPQSAALILHEYSELVGLSEEQAIRAQQVVLDELRQL